MKIQFTAPHTDGFGKKYETGWVADWSDPDARAAIEAGFAVPAPEGAYPRKTAAPVFECAVPAAPLSGGEFVKTGEKINLQQLTEEEKKSALASTIGRVFKK